MQLSLPPDFLQSLQDLEQAYLRETDPIRQSGFRGGADRWRQERGLILQAIDRSGDFLDIGCANGYLLECLVQWAAEQRIQLTPFGVDQGAELIELAKQRFPQLINHFWVANGWNWQPARKFQYVYTLYDCVPIDCLTLYIQRLLDTVVQPAGTLILGAYGSRSRQIPAYDLCLHLQQARFKVAGSAQSDSLPVVQIVWVLNQ